MRNEEYLRSILRAHFVRLRIFSKQMHDYQQHDVDVGFPEVVDLRLQQSQRLGFGMQHPLTLEWCTLATEDDTMHCCRVEYPVINNRVAFGQHETVAPVIKGHLHGRYKLQICAYVESQTSSLVSM